MRVRSPTRPCSLRPRPSRQITPADQGPRPRSRLSHATTSRVGNRCRRSRSTERESRTSVEAFLATRPSRPSSAAPTFANVAWVGGRLELAAWQAIAADQPGLEQPRLACSDQLTAERPQQRVIDGGTPHRSHSLEAAGCFADERVARELLQKRRVVVVEREHVADPGQRGRRVGSAHRDLEPPVAALCNPGCGGVPVRLKSQLQDVVTPTPRRVVGSVRDQRQVVRPNRVEVRTCGGHAQTLGEAPERGLHPPVGPPGPGVISWLGGARRICK